VVRANRRAVLARDLENLDTFRSKESIVKRRMSGLNHRSGMPEGGCAMKSVMWACIVAGVFLIGSVVPADAGAAGSRGGYHGGGGGRSGGAPQGGAWVSGGGYRGGGGTYTAAPRGSAWVSGGRYYGGYHGGGHRGGGWYGGTRVYIGGGVGWWGWPGWWGPGWSVRGWWGPGWWGWPAWGGTGWWGAPAFAAPPVVIQQAPTTFIQQEPAPPQDFWYFCQGSGAYFPYVKECPGGWMQVVPQSAPPDR
jgi:hypothetical protein